MTYTSSWKSINAVNESMLETFDGGLRVNVCFGAAGGKLGNRTHVLCCDYDSVVTGCV
jgi:hypothetical protein